MDQRESMRENGSDGEAAAASDALLVEQLRRGDADAVHRFFRDYYPAIYRYLLWLTGRPEMAEDLTQETFVRAWRALTRSQARIALRPWLHRIAHREFLRAARSQRSPISLDEMPEAASPDKPNWGDALALREAIRKLPRSEQELVVLSYLHGYSSAEIARIVHAPAGTVRYRLSLARERLQRELGEGDLPYLNEPFVPMRQWQWLPLDQMYALETRPRSHPRGGSNEEDTMERREFLRQAAVGAAGLMLTEPEKEIIDPRLTQKVTCAFKATALADLCEKLKADTGVHLTAGPSVADEKVTLFCEKLPLREVMRQLSRPFGYTWLRTGQALGVGRWALGNEPSDPNAQRPTPNALYRYELVQDLRSQLLEEELRNRDRNAALLALEAEIEKYRPYLGLSPDEVLARAHTAPPAEKQVLESLGGGRPGPGLAWGVTQMYFRLTPQQLAALRAGEELRFSQHPAAGDLRSWDQPLPPRWAAGCCKACGL